MTPHKQTLTRENDLAIITVELTDKNGLHIPTAGEEINFDIKGGGRIIGVGNGDPTSLEKDRFIDEITLLPVTHLQEQPLSSTVLPKQLPLLSEDNWKDAFKKRDYKNLAPAYAYRGGFYWNNASSNDTATFFYQKIGVNAVVFLNGAKISAATEDSTKFVLSPQLLRKGLNTLIIIATPVHKIHDWDPINENPGMIQRITAAGNWKRKLFNGYAQVIVQADGSGEDIEIKASGMGLKGAELWMKVINDR